jgi:hypothetical protein
MLYIGPGVTVTEIARITMMDSTSVLFLDGCTFYTGYTGSWDLPAVPGMTLTKGTVIFDNQVKIINCAVGDTPNIEPADGFILGDGTAVNDVDVKLLSNAYVVVDGYMEYNHS